VQLCAFHLPHNQTLMQTVTIHLKVDATATS